MRNITISVDEDTYRRARIWAAERGTSVSAIVKCILTTLPARAYTPPGNKRPVATQSGCQPPVTPAPARDNILIPAWGLSVLRATGAHFPPGKDGGESKEKSEFSE